MPGQREISIGFSESPIVSAIIGDFKIHDTPLSTAIFAADGSKPLLILLSLDLMSLDNSKMRLIRSGISSEFGLAEHRIVIHVTHTHSAPFQHLICAEKLLDSTIDSIRKARDAVQPAKFAFAKAGAGRSFSRNRRWNGMPELGTFTIIDNSSCVFKDGEIYIKKHIETELSRIGHPEIAVMDDAKLDGPIDDEISLLHFVDKLGRSLGGIVRFSAHPDQIALRKGPILSAEYPGFLRRRLAKKFGGTFLFLNGPCADLKPYYEKYEWDACKSLGEGLADLIIAAMPAKKTYARLKSINVYADSFHLEPRTDIGHSFHGIVKDVFELHLPSSDLSKLPPKKARELDGRRWLSDALAYTLSCSHGGDAKALFSPRAFPIELLVFNKIIAYLCTPDEIFTTFTQDMKKCAGRFSGGLQTVSMCNGASWYLPPKKEFENGGYEPTLAISAPSSFDQLKRNASLLLERASNDQREVWSEKELARQLKDAGIRTGDTLLVHSAVRSCGYVEGGLKTMLASLREALGKWGTLLLPTFTGSLRDSPEFPPSFDRRRSQCWTGALPQVALSVPGSMRSFHPTHSCVSLGPMSDELIRDHFFSSTPIDEKSPIRKLAMLGGKILIIGLDLKCLTLVHAVEEILKNPDPCHSKPCNCLMIDGARRELQEYFLHDWSVPHPDYEIYRPALERFSAIRPVRFADAQCWLINAKPAYDAIFNFINTSRKTNLDLSPRRTIK